MEMKEMSFEEYLKEVKHYKITFYHKQPALMKRELHKEYDEYYKDMKLEEYMKHQV